MEERLDLQLKVIPMRLLNGWIILTSNTHDYASPVCPFLKKNDEIRLVVYYRAMNAITKMEYSQVNHIGIYYYYHNGLFEFDPFSRCEYFKIVAINTSYGRVATTSNKYVEKTRCLRIHCRVSSILMVMRTNQQLQP
ncbi:hypothetical protein RF11_13147 [Thelohanellus kitauei]|uniref:Uncharacterized protein n=1 Tax=Thelohanellus kitauei TaxID=669202 RepID=A0A0C2N3U5_THEKT|nr:hypothetical protein RF11_13147 [Thelohanellus kitauei]